MAGVGALAVLLYASVVLTVVLVGIPLLALTVLSARELVAAHRWLTATLPRRATPGAVTVTSA